MNIEQYKNRFYNLMESTMGDVKPLITESETNKLEGFRLTDVYFPKYGLDPTDDNLAQKAQQGSMREWILAGKAEISNGTETKNIAGRLGSIGQIYGATAECKGQKGKSFNKDCTVYFKFDGDSTKYGCNSTECWVQDSSGVPSSPDDVTAQK